MGGLRVNFFIKLLGAEQVEQSTQHDPDDQHQIGLLADAYPRQTGDGDQLQDDEDAGERGTDVGHCFKEGFGVLIPLDGRDSGQAGEAEADGCADGGHIQEPAQSLTAQNGAEQGHRQAEQHGISGHAVLGVQLAEEGGEIAVAAHRIHQAGRGQIEAHHTGQHRAGYRHTHQDHAGGTQQTACRLQQQPGGGLGVDDQFGPVLQRRRRDGVVGGIYEAAEGDGHEHDQADLLVREFKFLRRLGDGIEAHKSPRGDGKGGQDRGGDARGAAVGEFVDAGVSAVGHGGDGTGLIKAPDGCHVGDIGLGGKQGGRHQCEYGAGQQDGENGLHDSRLLYADEVKYRKQHQNRHSEDHLAEIDVKSGDGVVEAELQDVGAAVQAVHDQADGGGIHRHVGQIRRHQEPAADIGGDLTEAGFGKGELTARLGVFRHHIGVAEGDDHHHQCTHHHSDGRTGDAGVGQELFAGVNEGAPADDATESDGPHVHRVQLLL